MNYLDLLLFWINNILEIGFKKSTTWKEYCLGPTKNHCKVCDNRNHKVYHKDSLDDLPEHPRCLCYYKWLKAQTPGKCTSLGKNGADYYIYNYKKLPDYYISKEEAKVLGWEPLKGNLQSVAPGKMIGGNIYKNKEGKLPSADGRIWYECDIEYASNYRGSWRLVYSNDGLIFMTIDHYETFISVE